MPVVIGQEAAGAITQLGNYGPVGLFAAIVSFALIYIYKSSEKKQEEALKRHDAATEVCAKRHDELVKEFICERDKILTSHREDRKEWQQESNKRAAQVTGALEKLDDSIRLLHIERAKEDNK